jgi:cold shock CspA family protein
MASERYSGTVRKVFIERGFLFIKTNGAIRDADSGGRDIFSHASDMARGDFDNTKIGDRVTFEVSTDPTRNDSEGLRARNVRKS